MINENEKFYLNAEYLFPEAALRLKILENLKNSWQDVLPSALARHSFPYKLGANELSVSFDNKKAEEMLNKSSGTILRILKRFGYMPQGEFRLKITKGVFFTPGKTEPRRKIFPDVEITDEEIKEQMKGAPETLSEDINYAISHLKIFLEKRFNNVKKG